MKRLSLISVFLMVCAMMCAGPVSKESARKIAEEFLTRKASSHGMRRAARMQAAEPLQWNAQPSEASMYLFNAADGNGFVIVSGDDRTEPILGYSDTGSIDTENMPQNMRSWLQHYADEIAIIQKYNLRNVRRSVATCGPAIEKQLTCLWDQDAPYNLLCPMVEQYKDEACTITYKPAGQAVTGCAATALAQVLYMHQDATVLLRDIEARKDVVHNSISRESGEMVWQKFSDSAIPAGTKIDWANIHPTYKGVEGLSDDEKLAISTLMHVCGGAMNMIYGLGDEFEGSTAMGEDGVKAACFYLGYDHAAAHFQDCYPYQEWLQLLYDELKVAKAVYFGGVSSGSGHAFVIDGYDKEDLFHINWGWSGVANEAPDNGGYYRLNSLLPSDQGYGGSLFNDGFRMGQIFGTGIYPGAPSPTPMLYVSKFRTGSKEITKENGKFSIPDVEMILYNMSLPLLPIRLGFIIQGQQGQKVDAMPDIIPIALGQNVGGTSPYETDGLTDGEYLLYPCFQVMDTEDWIPCQGYERLCLKLKVADDKMSIENVAPYTLTCTETDAKAEYLTGEDVMVNATIKVEYGDLHEMINLNMAALDEEGNTIGTMPCGREMYYVEADGTFDVKYAIGSSLPEGRYRLFVSSNMLEVEGTVCTFTVTNAPTGIHTVRSVTDRTDKFEYNLKGQRTDGTYKGITIRNGKKIINR